MRFFTSEIFWLIEGILLCLAVIGFKIRMEDRGERMTPLKWLLVIVWLGFFGFTVAFIGTSLGENEIEAASKGGILFGLIAVVSGAGLWRLLTPGKDSNEQ